MSKSDMGSVNGDEMSPWEAHGSSAQEEKIFVSVRLRPLNERELARNDVSDWECINTNTILYKNVVHERSVFPTALSFDRVFGSDCSTRQVYEEAAKKIAFSVVSGINSSIFAYGQTSSGKTYTMSGITDYTIADIYDYINKHRDREYVLKFSAIEIYNECVKDLLSYDGMPLRLLDDPEKGTVVEKLSEVALRDYEHLKELLSICEAQRQIGETALNEMSSRSHQILRLSVESSVHKFSTSQNSSTLASTVDFVDLAGSERASQTSAVGSRLKEGSHINRSLLTLGTVIRKLSKGRNGHIPFRDSKLTRILQNSLGGNARTAIICTVSPAHSHVEQSRNTLLFASCAKQVSTNAQVNVVMSEKALVKQLQKELARLENELRNLTSHSTFTDSSSALKEKELLLEKKDEEIRELTQQRDMAQSRLQGLIQSDGGHRRPRSLGEFSESPGRAWLEDYPSSEGSVMAEPHRYSISGISNFSDGYKALEPSKSDIQFPENEEQFLCDDTSPTEFIDKYFGPDPCQGWEKMTAQTTDQHIEDFCKEVPCIDIDVDKNESQSPGPVIADDDNESLKGKEEDLKETIDSAINTHPTEETPISSEMEKDDGNVPPSSVEEEIPENIEVKKTTDLEDEIPENIEEVKKTTDIEDADNQPDEKEEKPKISIEESTDSHTELNEDDNPKTQDQVLEVATKIEQSQCEEISGRALKPQPPPLKLPEIRPKLAEDSQQSPSRKDGLELIENPPRTPLSWSVEFERQRREIIELWDACNITLVHRTYFFLLFRGEPSDSIYMEVELRRLSYLKTTFSQGCSLVKNNKVLTKASSVRALNREREMLSKQVGKKFSSKEREALYLKWGVGLKSKQRRLQLCRRLWADTKDMDHIKESAALVASLVGMVEPSHAPKEIFGLCLPQPVVGTKSHGWSVPFLTELGF